jgi:ABC-type multidrug transport system ATPase subunit
MDCRVATIMGTLSSVLVSAVQHNDDDVLLVRNLVKKYARNLTAVKGISFGVAPGECFGLLGVNGAGKTTTFRMLTGDEIPTEGEAWVRQYSLSKDKSEVGTIDNVPCTFESSMHLVKQ